MNKTELFFFIYYGIALQFFLIPIASLQIFTGAGFTPPISVDEGLFLEKIGIGLFIAPLCVGSYFVVRAWLAGRVKIQN